MGQKIISGGGSGGYIEGCTTMAQPGAVYLGSQLGGSGAAVAASPAAVFLPTIAVASQPRIVPIIEHLMHDIRRLARPTD